MAMPTGRIDIHEYPGWFEVVWGEFVGDGPTLADALRELAYSIEVRPILDAHVAGKARSD